MYWIALLPSHEDERTAWGWRALQFTPRVAEVDEQESDSPFASWLAETTGQTIAGLHEIWR